MRARRTGLVPRPQFVRDARIFVIAVEGEKTEARYFSLFRGSRVHVEVLPAGPEGLSAPKQVLERLVKFEERFDLGEDDERWLVIDVDRQRGQFLDEVTQVARESGYGLAISNPCFELWLLLHFQEADTADTNCDAVIERLRPHTGGHNKARIRLDPYTADSIQAAVARAKALEGERDTRWPAFPGTHVFKVVEKLLQFCTL
jgi:hypothetical protein